MTKKLKEMIHLAMCKRWSKASVLALLMAVFAMPAFAQEEVKGVVIDSHGDPVIGATVVQKDNRQNGTITDFDGNFTLKLPGGKGTIVVTYVGTKAKEVRVTAERTARVTLEDDDTALEECRKLGEDLAKAV